MNSKPSTDPSAARPPRHRPIKLIIAAAVVILVLIFWVHHSQSQNSAKGKSGMGGPLPVMARPAAKGDLNIYLNGLGTVTPTAAVTIRTQISGQLIQVNFQEGQDVKQGDLLAVIDPRPYEVALEQAQGQLQQAQAQLKVAQLDLARYQTLATQDSIAHQQVDTEQALVNQYEGLVRTDQGAVDSAKLNITYCHIAAPLAGRVGLRQVDQGNYVTPGDANGLVVLTQVRPITVIFTLPEDNIPDISARLRSGATLAVDAFDRTVSKKIASGSLSTTDNQVDPATGTLKLRALFANEDNSLFPGQFVNVRMLLNVDRDATVIPTSAVERGQQGSFVYVVQPDNTVLARPVTLGTTEGERVAVVSGLEVGERVVTDGADKLKDHDKVIMQTRTPDGAPGAEGLHRHSDTNGGQN